MESSYDCHVIFQLKDYLAKLTKKVVEEGFIEGLFLTGLDNVYIYIIYIHKYCIVHNLYTYVCIEYTYVLYIV